MNKKMLIILGILIVVPSVNAQLNCTLSSNNVTYSCDGSVACTNVSLIQNITTTSSDIWKGVADEYKSLWKDAVNNPPSCPVKNDTCSEDQIRESTIYQNKLDELQTCNSKTCYSTTDYNTCLNDKKDAENNQNIRLVLGVAIGIAAFYLYQKSQEGKHPGHNVQQF